MGWYRVIKTVKGRQYAYMQRSWREGRHVLTESLSLGPVVGNRGAANGEDMALPRPFLPPTLPVITTKAPGTEPRTRPVTKQGIRFRFDPGKVKVSAPRLEADFRKMRNLAERLGVSAGGFPGLVVASGTTLQHRRARFSNNIVVMVPKDLRNRSAIRKEAHRAMARAVIDGLRNDCPSRFVAMAGGMDASFRETNNLLFRYLAAEDGASKLALSLQSTSSAISRHLADGCIIPRNGLAFQGLATACGGNLGKTKLWPH